MDALVSSVPSFILSCLGKGVPEGNGPVPQDTSGLLGRITLEEIHRIMSEVLDKSFDNFYGLKPENPKEMRVTYQRLAGVKHNARQPRLATGADVEPDTKTRKCVEDIVEDQVKNGNSCSAKRVDAGPTSLTSFGLTADPVALSRRDDVLVDKGAEAPKTLFSLVEMRTLTAAGSLLSVGAASTAMRTIFPRPLFP